MEARLLTGELNQLSTHLVTQQLTTTKAFYKTGSRYLFSLSISFSGLACVPV